MAGQHEVGRCTLSPPYPQLKGAWYPGGFKPLPLNINPGFKTCRFKCNLRRYSMGAMLAPGMAAMAGGYAGGGAGAGVGMGGMGALGLDPAAMFAQVQAHLAGAGAMGGGGGGRICPCPPPPTLRPRCCR